MTCCSCSRASCSATNVVSFTETWSPRTCSSTNRVSSRLLTLAWQGRSASPSGCTLMRCVSLCVFLVGERDHEWQSQCWLESFLHPGIIGMALCFKLRDFVHFTCWVLEFACMERPLCPSPSFFPAYDHSLNYCKFLLLLVRYDDLVTVHNSFPLSNVSYMLPVLHLCEKWRAFTWGKLEKS